MSQFIKKCKKPTGLLFVAIYMFMNIYVLQQHYDGIAPDDHAAKAFFLFVLLVLNAISWDFIKWLLVNPVVDWGSAGARAFEAFLSFLLMGLGFLFTFQPINGQWRVVSAIVFIVFNVCFAISCSRFVKVIAVNKSKEANLERIPQ